MSNQVIDNNDVTEINNEQKILTNENVISSSNLNITNKDVVLTKEDSVKSPKRSAKELDITPRMSSKNLNVSPKRSASNLDSNGKVIKNKKLMSQDNSNSLPKQNYPKDLSPIKQSKTPKLPEVKKSFDFTEFLKVSQNESQLDQILRINGQVLKIMNQDGQLQNCLQLLRIAESKATPEFMGEDEILRALSVTQNNQACVFKQLNLPKLAFMQLLKCLQCEIRFKEPQNISSTQTNISTILSSMGRHEDALKQSRIAIQMFNKLINEENSDALEDLQMKVNLEIMIKKKEYTTSQNNSKAKFKSKEEQEEDEDNPFKQKEKKSTMPIDINRYLLKSEHEQLLWDMRPLKVPKVKEHAQALIIYFNNLGVQYENTGNKRVAVEYYFKSQIVSKYKISVTNYFTKKQRDIIDSLLTKYGDKLFKNQEKLDTSRLYIENNQSLGLLNNNSSNFDLKYVSKIIAEDLQNMGEDSRDLGILSNLDRTASQQKLLQKIKVDPVKLKQQNEEDKDLSRMRNRIGKQNEFDSISHQKRSSRLNNSSLDASSYWDNSVVVRKPQSSRNITMLRDKLQGNTNNRSQSVQKQKNQSNDKFARQQLSYLQLIKSRNSLNTPVVNVTPSQSISEIKSKKLQDIKEEDLKEDSAKKENKIVNNSDLEQLNNRNADVDQKTKSEVENQIIE